MMDKVNSNGNYIGATEDGFKKKAHTFDEALNLAGNGCYNIGLLATLSLSFTAMCIDMFSFSVVVSLASCDLQLDLTQKSILLSTPFVGPILMAYAWGYISDTKGRKFSMMIGLTGGFVMSSLCAFAPNWVVLAILKFIGTCLALAYYLESLSFVYDLGFITFVPWRLLVIVLALPLGLSSVSLIFFHESPKFLVNAGLEDQALEILRSISKRNGVHTGYPVQSLVLNEEGNVRVKDSPLLKSLWEQTAPLFKPPLLLWTLLLYYLTFVLYGSAGSLYVWMPFLANAIISKGNSSSVQNQDFCGIITSMNNVPSEDVPCSATIDVTMVYSILIVSGFNFGLNMLMSMVASRKRALTIGVSFLSMASAVITVTMPNRVSGFFYFGMTVSSLGSGLIASYFVDLFPTSFRGMASCLGVMVTRLSNVVAINIVGPFIMSHCNVTLYGMGAFFASGILTALLLPPDRPKKLL